MTMYSFGCVIVFFCIYVYCFRSSLFFVSLIYMERKNRFHLKFLNLMNLFPVFFSKHSTSNLSNGMKCTFFLSCDNQLPLFDIFSLCSTAKNITLCSYHVTYLFQSESTLHTCLIVNELFAGNRRNTWSLSDSNEIRTHSHLVRKRTPDHLAKPANLTSLVKWLSVRLRTKWLWVRIPLLPLTQIIVLRVQGHGKYR